MNDWVEIHWTSGSIDEARKVCRYLVQERIVASAEIIPWVESIYLLNNELETTQETRVIFKSKCFNFEKIKTIITSNSTYDVPEIVSIPLQQINEVYLSWLEESLSL